MSLEKHKIPRDYKGHKWIEWKTDKWRGLAKPKVGSLKVLFKIDKPLEKNKKTNYQYQGEKEAEAGPSSPSTV